ncbi:MAG TPA: LPP20 family lipoprotein [Gammaproteobacteria bacterium]|nr:LPP20 family lipoprotein [Gammaproteobacteria bacterium]
MMRTGHLITLPLPLLLAMLIGACSHAPRPDAQPAWVNGPSAKFPASRYLTGRGEADTRAVARDRARADLAKTFSVKISEHSEDTASYSQSGAAPAANTLDVNRYISTQTDALLRGVRVVDTWQDPATRVYYALAALSRSQAAAALRERIAQLDAATHAWVAQARGNDELIAKIAAADHAVNAQAERAALQNELRVVDITGRGIAPQWNLGQLQADRAELLARLTITPAVEGKDAAAMRKLLAGALADAGFTVETGAPYTMTAALDYSPLPPRNGWYWITGTLSVALDGAGDSAGRAHGIQRWPLKVSATDPALAKQRLLDQVAQNLHNDIQATVLRFAGAGDTAD